MARDRRALRANDGRQPGGHRHADRFADLYVRRTFATSETHVILVLDARDAIGPDVSTWDSGDVHPDDATSLDVARRAAASFAQRYLDQGDRVASSIPDVIDGCCGRPVGDGG